MNAAPDHQRVIHELTDLMGRYEAANNSHEPDRVLPFIARDASYWFSDGSHEGHEQIRAALETTFRTIQDEHYVIEELAWVVVRPDVAVCRYKFTWTGIVDGQPHAGMGRGTNVLAHVGPNWQIVHEQLTADT